MEMFENEVKLWDLNNKKSNLLAEIRDNLEPEDEFKSLLNRIKEDKLQIGIMEKAISEISEEIRHGEAVLTQLQEKVTKLILKQTALPNFHRFCLITVGLKKSFLSYAKNGKICCK